MNKKSFIPLIILFSIAFGFLIGRFVYKSNNIFYARNKDFKKLQSLIRIVKNNYSDKFNVFDFLRKDLIKKLSAIDPYTDYFTEKEYNAYKARILGEFVGIGIRYSTVDDTMRILSVMKNSPAEKAGLQSLDAILKLNKQNLISLPADSLSNMIKNDGKTIKLTVKNFRTNQEKSIKLKKDKIQINPISYYYLGDSIAYIKVKAFQKNTYDFFIDAENNLIKNHHISKVILDLRFNGGGFLKTSVNLVDQFFNKGDTIVSTLTNSKDREYYLSTNKGNFKNVKLIVLVNGATASAAELITLALQDNDRALILGSRTYGKGVFQQDIPILNDNIAHITTGKYFGPSGRNINNSHDSVSLFRTKTGRIVYNNNAITPDIICDSIDLSAVVNNLDILFIPMIDRNKKSILSCSDSDELYKTIARINPIEQNPYLNYLSDNTDYYNTLKFLSVAKFILPDSAYKKLSLNRDYCLQKAVSIFKNNKTEQKIFESDTLKPIASKIIH